MAIRIEITGVDNFSGTSGKVAGALGKLQNKTQETGATMKQTWKDVALAVGTFYIAFNKAKQVFEDLIGKYEKQIVAETKLASALKATGYAAGLTEGQLRKMSESMAAVTTYADEALLEAEGLLLTFTQIGKTVFPQALEAAADMSTMFGQDLKQSVIQLGTALNDPIAGIGRLRRIGISFTEEQKEMIKGFVELGDVMSAQQVIIDEINREFGGVARMMGETAIGAFRRLENKWGDLQEKAGQALLEGIAPLFAVIEDFINFLQKNVEVFSQIGSAIAFVGTIVIGVIKFIIQFKEAIITFIAIAWGVPTVLGAISTAMGILNAVVMANPFALIAAAVVGVVSVVGGMVAETMKANEELRKLKEEASELARGELSRAAGGLVKDMGELQSALAQAKDQITELQDAYINANKKEQEALWDLIDTYLQLQKKIEKQIEIRREIELLEKAKAGELSAVKDYAEAVDIANRKLAENESSLTRLISFLKETKGLTDAAVLSEESVIQLKTNIKYWKDLISQIDATQKEVAAYGTEWKQVIEQRKKMEEDYADKYFDLVNDRIAVLEKERAKAIEEAQKIGAGTYNIWRYYNEQINRENQKAEREREDFEKEWNNKLFQLTASRVQILAMERDEAIRQAREKGYETAAIEKYYRQVIRQAQEQAREEELKAEAEKLDKILAEQEAYARQRMALEKEVSDYILALADEFSLSEADLIRKRRDEEILRIEEVADKWRESIGYMNDEADRIQIPFEAITYEDLLDGSEQIIDRTEEYNALLKEAEANEIKIRQAISQVNDKYAESIRNAEERNRLTGLVGESYLDEFAALQKITQEMKTQEEVQKANIESQIRGLEQLIRSVETRMVLAGISAEDIINSLPYMQIIRDANKAMEYLNAELDKIPTEADKAFLDLSQKVGSILEKYKDPLQKKKEALEIEAKMVTEYVSALKERYSEQAEQIRSMRQGSEEYEKAYAELYNLALTIGEAENLTKEIDAALQDVEKEIAEAGKDIKKYTIKTLSQMIDELTLSVAHTLINLPSVIADSFVAIGNGIADFFTGAFKLFINPVKQLEKIFTSFVSGIAEATWSILDGLAGLYDAIFQEGIEKYARTKGKSVEDLSPEEQGEARVFAGLDMFANILGWIVQQLINLVVSTEVFQRYMNDFGEALRIVIESAVIPLIQAFHPLAVVVVQVAQIIFQLLVPVFQILGKIIQLLMPLFVAVGQLIINIIGLLRLFAPILGVIIVTVGRILTPIIEALSGVFGFLGEVVSALTPVFDAIGFVVDAVGKVFRTLMVIIDFITSPFRALGELIYYIITFQWDKIGSIHVMTPAELVQALSDIWTEGWATQDFKPFDVDFEDVPTLELEMEDITDLQAEDFGATVYGGNVSVQQAPDIYIYQTFQGNVIGAGGMTEVGEFVVEAIREYVGAGGQVVWEEA